MVVKSESILSFFKIFVGKYLRGITIWPFIFIGELRIKNDVFIKREKVLINHEKIHLRQQLELLIIPFYIWYFIEMYRFGYKNISFEREAFQNEKDLNYLKNRKPYAFLKFKYKKNN